MKIKLYLIISTIILLTISMNSAVTINDVEYLKGDDFVRLHFKTDQIIPIPELFYPVEDNFKFIVMRMSKTDIRIIKKNFRIDSAIIDTVDVKESEQFFDVEIHLKVEANYRVFTNQNGLFVEFPKVKNTSKNSQEIPVKKAVPGSFNRKLQEPAVAKTIPNKKKLLLSNSNYSGAGNLLKNVKVVSKTKNRIKFEFQLTEKTKYTVIPIEKFPYRLALDLKNVVSRQIFKEINSLNVKRIRGAYNTPQVFRVVFDLEYLKKYNVAQAQNTLVVEFFDNNYEVAKTEVTEPKIQAEKKPEIVKTKAEPSASTPDKKPAWVKNTTSNITTATDHKSTPGNGSKPLTEAKKDPVRFETAEKVQLKLSQNTESKPAATKTQSGPKAVNPDEFFTAEKSETSPENTNFQADDDSTQLSYLRNTIQSGKKKYTGDPVTFKFTNADLSDVIIFFARTSGLNIVIDPGVSGKITAEMTQVPWDQALELFLKINNLDMVLEENILRIGNVDKLKNEAEKRRQMAEARAMEGKLEVFTRYLNYANVKDIAPILKKQLSSRGEIIQDARSNTLIISEVPNKIDLIDRLIDTLDAANPQVSIEARIVETNSNAEKNLGIQWGYNFMADAAHGNQTSLQFPNSVAINGSQIYNDQNPGVIGNLGGYAINLPASGRTIGTAFSFGNVANTFRLDMALTALVKNGEGRIISAPKTTTQNNQEAHIEQGKQIPVQTIQNNTVTVKYVPASLELKVTPHITAKGTIICTLDIKNNAADFANKVNGIPPITTQSIKTTIMVGDGGTIVIGGMYRVEESETRNEVPLLSKIPILGNLFKSKESFKTQKELLVFITPRIIK